MTDSQATTPPTGSGAAVRIVALTAAGVRLPLAFARLVDALRRAGADVTPVPVPRKAPAERPDRPPRLSDLKAGLQALADTVAATLSGAGAAAERSWLDSQLAAVEGHVDAVVCLDPEVAAQVYPAAARVWPEAVRVAVDGDYHLDPAWDQVAFDDLVLAHAGLATGIARLREGRARPRTGGPLVGGEAVEAKRVTEDRPAVVVSCARLASGDVDPLLFQLSLAHPEGFELLFLPSGRSGVDELVRTRAGNYGLQAKRPKAGADPEPWIRGAAALVGRPSPAEAAAAVQAGVPQLLVGSDTGDAGDTFLVQHGAAARAEVHLTIAVSVEGMLPGGPDRDRYVTALSELRTDGAAGAARAVIEAARAGRPKVEAVTVEATTSQAGGGGDGDELEDIGVSAAPLSTAPTSMSKELRRAYLSEIILQQGEITKQLGRAKGGLDTWKNRARLALTAGDRELAAQASRRVAGLERIASRLDNQVAQLQGLRDRFAGRDQLTEADRQAAARFMSPEVASSLDRGQAYDPEAFTRLELNDALAQLKDRLKGS